MDKYRRHQAAHRFDELPANVLRFSCRRGAPPKSVKMHTISRAEGGQLQAPVGRRGLTRSGDKPAPHVHGLVHVWPIRTRPRQPFAHLALILQILFPVLPDQLALFPWANQAFQVQQRQWQQAPQQP
jgi:hypothetical protein